MYSFARLLFRAAPAAPVPHVVVTDTLAPEYLYPAVATATVVHAAAITKPENTVAEVERFMPSQR